VVLRFEPLASGRLRSALFVRARSGRRPARSSDNTGQSAAIIAAHRCSSSDAKSFSALIGLLPISCMAVGSFRLIFDDLDAQPAELIDVCVDPVADLEVGSRCQADAGRGSG
jgi:hypothetical protein